MPLPLAPLIEYFQKKDINNTVSHLDFSLFDTYAVNESMSALIYAFCYNKKKNLNLTPKQWQYLIHNSDLSYTTKKGYNALLCVLVTNKKENINIESTELGYLIENSYLDQQNEHGDTALILSIKNNKKFGLQLSREQFTYLIDNSNVNILNHNGESALYHAILYNKEEQLYFNNKQWAIFFEKYDFLNSKENISARFIVGNKSNSLNLSSKNFITLFNKNKNNIIYEDKTTTAAFYFSIFNYEEEDFTIDNKAIDYLIRHYDLRIKDDHNNDCLHYISQNQSVNFGLSAYAISYIIRHYDFHKYLTGKSCLGLKMQLDLSTWEYLFNRQNDLYQRKNLLSYIVKHNIDISFFQSIEVQHILNDCNYHYRNENNQSVLMQILSHNYTHLKSEQLHSIVEKSDICQQDVNGRNVLMLAIDSTAPLSHKSFQYILKHTDFSQSDNNKYNALYYAFNSKIALGDKKMDAIIEKSNICQRYKGAQNILTVLMNTLNVKFNAKQTTLIVNKALSQPSPILYDLLYYFEKNEEKLSKIWNFIIDKELFIKNIKNYQSDHKLLKNQEIISFEEKQLLESIVTKSKNFKNLNKI